MDDSAESKDLNKITEIRKRKQAYPKYQPKLEKLQLKLNHAAVMNDMKQMGKYTAEINEIWDKYNEK